jgi:hypothetical protein
MAGFSPKARVFSLVAFLALLNAAMAFSQVVTGAISGRVFDSTGALVPGASIQMENVETGFSRTVQTDREGRYVARNLPLGAYSVTGKQAGFRTEVRSGIVLAVGSEATVDFQLNVGTAQETVVVTGEAAAIETTTSTLSGLVTPDDMRNLPLNGRDYQQLALLSPGVISNTAAGFIPSQGMGLRLSINGSRADAILYLLDGTVVNDHSTNGPGSAAQESLGVEGILEFRLLTHNFTAEYGRNSGAVMSAVTRSGTNEFHGSAYEFVRNNLFDARNFFNPGALPAFRRNQFGASFGGPLRKNRVFFFVNYEGLRQRQGTTITATVPDAQARTGAVPDPVTHALTSVPLSSIAVPYLKLYPLPNGTIFGDGTGQFVRTQSIPTNEDYAMERMDFRSSDKDTFYWRYVHDRSDTLAPAAIPPFASTTTGTNHFVVLSETHIFSAASLNEFRFGFNRTDPTFLGTTSIDPTLSFIPGLPFGTIQFSTASVGSTQLSNLGNNSKVPQDFVQNLYQSTDSFSIVRGAHSLKFGADVERIQLNLHEGDPTLGVYTFGGLLPLLAAQPSRFDFLLLGGDSTTIRGWRRTMFGWFLQDDFHVRPNLTLNLGFRHEFITSPYEVNGRSANLRQITDPISTLGPPFEAPRANFAPRVGLAWDPTGSGKTSIRLGVGIFFNHVDGRTFYGTADTDARFLDALTVSNPPFPLGSAKSVAPQLQSTGAVQFNVDTPTVIQYNFEVQRQLIPTLSLQLGYVGSDGYNMPREAFANIKIAQKQPDGSTFFPSNSPIINPGFADVNQILTDARYNYNAFQVVLQKTLSGGLRLQGSYSFSKTLSDADSISNQQITSTAPSTMDIHNLARDYGLSAYNQTHTFVFNSQYQMPWDNRLSGKAAKAVLGGWAINGIFRYGSGLSFNIQDGFNRSGNGDSGNPDRPNLAPGASYTTQGVTAGCPGIATGRRLGIPSLYFDPCVFQLPAVGTFGNLGRNMGIGPPLANVDFTLMKSTALSERKKLEFRVECFNLLNHANFALPNRSVFNSKGTYNGNDAVITNTVTANRQIQLGMKLVF